MGSKSIGLCRAWGRECLGYVMHLFILAFCAVLLASCAHFKSVRSNSAGISQREPYLSSPVRMSYPPPPPSLEAQKQPPPKVIKQAVPLPTLPPPTPPPPSVPPPIVEESSGNPAPLPPQDSLRNADAALAEELKANVVYNAPTTMMLGEPTDIELLISRNAAVKALEAQLDATGPERDAQIKVAEHVRAVLNGDGFDVKVLTSEEQLVGSSNVTQWRWRVTPSVSGSQRELDLTISDVLDDGRKEEVNAQAAYHSSIRVTVSVPWVVKKWVRENWKWSCTAVVFPLIAWAWKQRWGRNPTPKRRRPKHK